MDKCASSALFYNDIEDEDDEDIDDDFEEENEDDAEMNLSQESDFEALIEKSAGKKKLQIKFPNFTPKKQLSSPSTNGGETNTNQHIVTMSDDESSDDMDENKLEIDETYSEQM